MDEQEWSKKGAKGDRGHGRRAIEILDCEDPAMLPVGRGAGASLGKLGEL